jgi:hypothetical protein
MFSCLGETIGRMAPEATLPLSGRSLTNIHESITTATRDKAQSLHRCAIVFVRVQTGQRR